MVNKMSIVIYNRIKLMYVKKRIFPVILIVQNILISLIVLIYANLIISEGKIMGELNYQHIKTFYTVTIIMLFILPTIYSPYFLAKSVNELVKNNITLNLFSSKANTTNIILPCFLCGIFAVFVLTFSIFPIVIVSFYFGGISIYRFLIILLFLFFYILLISSISLYISTIISEPNLSIVLSYIINLGFVIMHIFLIPYVFNNYYFLIFYSFLVIMIFFVLFVFSKKSKLFSINLE